MPFDIDRLHAFASAQISAFAATHQHETFYAFAIDASLLCLNSEEAAASTLQKYQDDWNFLARPLLNWDDVTDRDCQREYALRFKNRHAVQTPADRAACLEQINATRTERRAEGNPNLQPEKAESLRNNTGDWAYQGFAMMNTADGFDDDAYEAHYDTEESEQPFTEYALAMDALVQRLVQSGAFDCLQRTAGFTAGRVEHDY